MDAVLIAIEGLFDLIVELIFDRAFNKEKTLKRRLPYIIAYILILILIIAFLIISGINLVKESNLIGVILLIFSFLFLIILLYPFVNYK